MFFMLSLFGYIFRVSRVARSTLWWYKVNLCGVFHMMSSKSPLTSIGTVCFLLYMKIAIIQPYYLVLHCPRLVYLPVLTGYEPNTRKQYSHLLDSSTPPRLTLPMSIVDDLVRTFPQLHQNLIAMCHPKFFQPRLSRVLIFDIEPTPFSAAKLSIAC